MIYKKKNFIFYKGNWENNLKNIKGIMLIKIIIKMKVNGKMIF